ncbi:CoA-transferase [Paenibacillus sp. FSL H8-0034]|uniref:CoA-transferase n=1 Tax=Paenibacillus sp. FSL H8-0034 TaxID=2954671 RepID=UPI0030F8D2DE
MKTRCYTQDELLICMLARELKDHEKIGVGNNSPVPAAAALLAQALHAPNATVYILGQPDWPFEGTHEFFNLMQRGGIDVFFLSGAQIDAYGNINLHVIGNYSAPKVRLPGGAGSAVVYFMCKRIFLFKTDHNAKGFPEKLDFVTSSASSEPYVNRNSQLEGVFTPLGIMRPSAREGGRLQLSHTAPGIEPLHVQTQTGFELGITSVPILEIAEPTAEELQLLRGVVNLQLKRIYPEFARNTFGTVEA